MIELREAGLYCAAGDFYIDPKRPVSRAVITHAHSDHARRGSQHYYCERSGLGLLRSRLGPRIAATTYPYGERFTLGRALVSFHSAGHILGSAQVRIEVNGEVWVASGDYKREADPTCHPFEPVPCDVFITEATFGTPSFRWTRNARRSSPLSDQLQAWWDENAAQGITSVILAYSLGKSQRILGELRQSAQRPILTHPAATELSRIYLEEGVSLAPFRCWSTVKEGDDLSRDLLILPPSSSPEIYSRLKRFRRAFASGWTASGNRGYDHGFVMSDHADWDDLIRTIQETGARQVFVQHRENGVLVRHLRNELGLDAYPESALKPSERFRIAPHPARQLSLF